MTKPDYIRMEELINTHIKDHGIGPYNQFDMNHERYCWLVYHATFDWLQYNNREDYNFMRSLYDYCNDDHIDTALRKIIK